MPLPQWEYRNFECKTAYAEDIMNTFGLEGWELVNCRVFFEGKIKMLSCYFKRQIWKAEE